MASSPTRGLTLQEKVLRKRRNKTAAVVASASSQEQALSPYRASKAKSPRQIQVKNQLVKAMGGTPSPTTSISPPPSSTDDGPDEVMHAAGEEQLMHDPHSSQQVESPLASTENKMEAEDDQKYPSKPQSHRGAESESDGGCGIEEREGDIKEPKRRRLPKWPPEQENTQADQGQNATRMAISPSTAKEEPITPTPPVDEVDRVISPSPTARTVEKVDCSTQTDLSLDEQAAEGEAAPSSNRSGSAAVNVSAFNGSSSLGRPVNKDTRTRSDETMVTQHKSPWTRRRIPSPSPASSAIAATATASGNHQKPSWIRSAPATERTPSPAPSNDASTQIDQQTVPWARSSSPATSDTGSQQMAPWTSRRRPPSPVHEPVASMRQQSASWAARSPSPVPSDVSSQSGQEKAPWIRTRTPSPSSVNVGSQQQAPWVRHQTKTPPAVVGSAPATSQQKGPLTTRAQTTPPVPETGQPVDTKRSSSPACGLSNASSTEEKAVENGKAPPRRNVETLEQRRAHILNRRDEEQGAAHSGAVDIVGKQEMESLSSQRGSPAPMSPDHNGKPRKRWPPVRTEPYSNAYKQQQASMNNDKEGRTVPIVTEMQNVKERPPESLSAENTVTTTKMQPNVEKETSLKAKQVGSTSVRRAPWLRTSPTAPTSNDGDRSSPSGRKFHDAANSAVIQQPNVSSVSTDEKKQQITKLKASQVRPPSNESISSDAVTSRKAPWERRVPNVGTATSRASDRAPNGTNGNLPRNSLRVDAATASSSSTRSGRKSVKSPSLPSRNILTEVKTRRAPLESSEGHEGGDEAKVVVSYGGAVIETPKSVSVSSVRSAFASGGSLTRTASKSDHATNPMSRKDDVAQPIKTGIENSPQPSNLLQKPSDSPPGPYQDRQLHSSTDSVRVGQGETPQPSITKRNTRGQWGQVQSPPPSWSKSAWSTGQQSSRKPPISNQFTFQNVSRTSKVSSGTHGASSHGARSPPPAWIKRSGPQGDMSSTRSPQRASKPLQSHVLSDRSPPPSWVNRDVSQGDMSSIRTPEWDSKPAPTRTGRESGTVGSSVPPSWIDGLACEDDLSPIESPHPSPVQRIRSRAQKEPPPQQLPRERIIVETVDDNSSVEDGVDHRWSDSVANATSENADVGEEVNYANDEQGVGERTSQGEGECEYDESTGEAFPESHGRSPSKTLAQMAMDSVFALDFDQVMAQAPRATSLDDDDSAGSSPSKGVAKSTPPERELPEEVQAILERTLSRSLSEPRSQYDSREYEADYFNTDVSNSAIDRSGSSWDQNDISALSHGSGLDFSSPEMEDRLHFPSTTQAETELHPPTLPSASRQDSNEKAEKTLERLQQMTFADVSNDWDKSASLPAQDANESAGGRGEDYEDSTSSESVQELEVSREGRDDTRIRGSEPRSMATSGNESTIDLGNPTDISISVSPDSPPARDLIGTNAASVLSGSPPDDFAARKTVRFSGTEAFAVAGEENDEVQRQPSVSERRHVFEELQESNVRDPIEPLPPPQAQDVSPPSAGARNVLEYFQPHLAHEMDESEKMADPLDVSEEWVRRDPDFDDILSEPTEATSVGRSPNKGTPPTSLPNQNPSWSRSFHGPDPFSKQDRDDPFMKQDDPFAASKSASGDFSDFNEVFNPFADDETFNFEDPSGSSAGFFSPYGDAPAKASATATHQSNALMPSRRDRKRQDTFSSPQATGNHSANTSSMEEGDEYGERARVQHQFTLSASTSVSSEDRSYLLEI